MFKDTNLEIISIMIVLIVMSMHRITKEMRMSRSWGVRAAGRTSVSGRLQYKKIVSVRSDKGISRDVGGNPAG